MAQDQLEKMKQRRQKIEMGAFYLKQHFDIKQKEANDLEVVRSLEREHRKTSLDPFDRNNQTFKNNIAQKIDRQQTILQQSVSPNQKYLNHALHQAQKDEEYQKRVSEEDRMREKMQTLHEENQRLHSLKKANTLKSTIMSQMDEASTNRKHERRS